MDFFYGKAPVSLFVVAIVSGLVLSFGGSSAPAHKPDLVFATFSKEHASAYTAAIAEFEREHGVTVQLQVVDAKALQGRLQSAMQVGAEVPDMVELLCGTLGTFTSGPVEDVPLLDLTDRVTQAGLLEKLVANRVARWSSRGRIYALPQDVHPVMLAYRRDLVAQLGIDPGTLTTWAEFCRVGSDVVKRSTDRHGVVNHYMIDLPADGSDNLRFLMNQHGASVFGSAGHVTFDDPKTVDVVCWYVKLVQETNGPHSQDRIAFPCGWGQTLSRAMIDGLCLFYVCPDWRTRQFQTDIPSLSGKIGLIPLPAWEPGGLRTSTQGGTGLAFTRTCRQPDLAWQLAMYLYYDPSQLGKRFTQTQILPPLRAAWTMPEISQPNPYFDGACVGTLYSQLAPQVPADYDTAYSSLASSKLSEAFTNTKLYYADHGDTGLREYAAAELKRCADRVRVVMGRNIFLNANQ